MGGQFIRKAKRSTVSGGSGSGSGVGRQAWPSQALCLCGWGADEMMVAHKQCTVIFQECFNTDTIKNTNDQYEFPPEISLFS